MSIMGLMTGPSIKDRARCAIFTDRSPMRSRSVLILSAATIRRRSAAMGCCKANRLMAKSSISISMALMRVSLMKTCSAALRSFCVTALMLRWMADSTSAPISSSLVFSNSRSSTKWRMMGSCSERSAEAAGHVVFRLFSGRGLEDHGGAVELDEPPQKEKTGVVGDARGLLHVVRDDGDGATALEVEDQILDLGSSDGIERRAGLVEQQHLRVHRQRARDAQALLLAARQSVGRLVEFVFHFLPQRGPAEALLHRVAQGRAIGRAVDAQPIGHVLKNGFGKRIGLLEHHSDTPADLGYFELVNIFPIQDNFSLHPAVADGFVHAVQGSEKRRLAATGGPDEGCHPTRV